MRQLAAGLNPERYQDLYDELSKRLELSLPEVFEALLPDVPLPESVQLAAQAADHETQLRALVADMGAAIDTLGRAVELIDEPADQPVVALPSRLNAEAVQAVFPLAVARRGDAQCHRAGCPSGGSGRASGRGRARRSWR